MADGEGGGEELVRSQITLRKLCFNRLIDARAMYCYHAIHAGVMLARAKEVRDDGSIVEIVIWELPELLPPSCHSYQYRLYYGADGISRVRYDNERGKGDHRHIDEAEQDYVFGSIEQLLEDFRSDVERWRQP